MERIKFTIIKSIVHNMDSGSFLSYKKGDAGAAGTTFESLCMTKTDSYLINPCFGTKTTDIGSAVTVHLKKYRCSF